MADTTGRPRVTSYHLGDLASPIFNAALHDFNTGHDVTFFAIPASVFAIIPQYVKSQFEMHLIHRVYPRCCMWCKVFVIPKRKSRITA